ncbi:MAG: hypothetical protein F6K36_31055, partial [Symploca sp. SIO3C6]|nr:hypothetical protein [Symploca sp. SIO3C6]
LKQFIPGQSQSSQEINTPVLKVRGKTIIFANSIYQISNIASLDLLDLSTEKPMPGYFLSMLIAGTILLFIPGNIKILGIVTLAVLGYLYYQWRENKRKTQYGLQLRMSSGFNTIITYSEMDFLVEIMVTLNGIMNTDEAKALTFNLDQRKIQVDQMTGSNIVTGSVQGDVVSNV